MRSPWMESPKEMNQWISGSHSIFSGFWIMISKCHLQLELETPLSTSRPHTSVPWPCQESVFQREAGYTEERMLLIPTAASVKCSGIQHNHNDFIHDWMLCSLKTKAVLWGGGKINVRKRSKGERDWAWDWDGEERSEAGALLWVGQVQLLVSFSLLFPSRKRASRSQPLIEAFPTSWWFKTKLEWLSLDQAQSQL